MGKEYDRLGLPERLFFLSISTVGALVSPLYYLLVFYGFRTFEKKFSPRSELENIEREFDEFRAEDRRLVEGGFKAALTGDPCYLRLDRYRRKTPRI